jgi:hypothetical protein
MVTVTRTEQIPAAKVDALMKARAADLDSWQRTIRNAVRGARRDGTSRFVGFTSLALFINTSADRGGAYRYEATGAGELYRIEVA